MCDTMTQDHIFMSTTNMHKVYAKMERSSDPDQKLVSRTKGVGYIREGFTSRSVDLQTGSISPMEILHLVTNSRAEYILNMVPERFPAFTLANDVSFSRDAYKLLKEKLPVTVESELTHIGRTSIVLETNMFLSGQPEQSLLTGREILVAVDLESRRSTPLPPYIVEMFKDLKNRRANSMPHVVKLDKPNETVCQGVPVKSYVVQATRRNLDPNGHVYYLNYIQYCIDALEIHLSREKVLCNFDTGCLQLKRIQFGAKSESSIGDILHVAFWDDTVDNATVCFDISMSGKCIFQAKMEFYEKHDLDSHQSKL